VSTLQAARLQTAAGAYGEMPRYVWQARSTCTGVDCSLEANYFLQAFFRFIHRRGGVSEIFSDNGTKFVTAERELRAGMKRWNQLLIHKPSVKRAFQPSAFSKQRGCLGNFGEISEENLGLMKERTLTDESHYTFLVEVEWITNTGH